MAVMLWHEGFNCQSIWPSAAPCRHTTPGSRPRPEWSRSGWRPGRVCGHVRACVCVCNCERVIVCLVCLFVSAGDALLPSTQCCLQAHAAAAAHRLVVVSAVDAPREDGGSRHICWPQEQLIDVRGERLAGADVVRLAGRQRVHGGADLGGGNGPGDVRAAARGCVCRGVRVLSVECCVHTCVSARFQER